MVDFITEVTRVGREINRSNLVEDIKLALNDAIKEAASTRYYFNEMLGITFPTVPGQEYYPDLGVTEIDMMWYNDGIARRNIEKESQADADDRAEGNAIQGSQIRTYARAASQLRLYPIPNAVYTINMDGYGRLTPNPLVQDTDTNNWLVEGEMYIRALTKRNVLRDRVRDMKEAAVFDAVAEDYKRIIIDATVLRISTGTIRPTQF